MGDFGLSGDLFNPNSSNYAFKQNAATYANTPKPTPDYSGYSNTALNSLGAKGVPSFSTSAAAPPASAPTSPYQMYPSGTGIVNDPKNPNVPNPGAPYQSLDYAQKVAAQLGGQIGMMRSGSEDAMGPPQYQIVMPNGATLDASSVASKLYDPMYSFLTPQQRMDSIMADINLNKGDVAWANLGSIDGQGKGPTPGPGYSPRYTASGPTTSLSTLFGGGQAQAQNPTQQYVQNVLNPAPAQNNQSNLLSSLLGGQGSGILSLLSLLGLLGGGLGAPQASGPYWYNRSRYSQFG